jgi:hypothetical protein
MENVSNLQITLNEIRLLNKNIQRKRVEGLPELFFLDNEEIQFSIEGGVSFVCRSFVGYLLGLIPIIFGSGTMMLLTVTTASGLTPLLPLGISIGITGSLLGCWFGLFVLYLKKNMKKYAPILTLIGETNRYNMIVSHIFTLEQLEKAGNPITLHEKGYVIEVLEAARSTLIRAFETAKILRQDPHITYEQLTLDLAVPEAMHISEQANQYGSVLNEALQLAMSVQEELKMLIQNRIEPN